MAGRASRGPTSGAAVFVIIIYTWMNRAAGWWTSAAATTIQNQQRAAPKAMTPKPVRSKTERKGKATR